MREPIGLRGDGSRPLCSGSQVRADNCQLCAAETDDYGLYCLSQAQSALIQQSRIALIYESRAPPPVTHTPSILCSLMLICFAFASLRSPFIAERPPDASLPSGRLLRHAEPLAGAALACTRCDVNGGVIATRNSLGKCLKRF